MRHIFRPSRTCYRKIFLLPKGDVRMMFVVLGILCVAVILVMLACLWVNR